MTKQQIRNKRNRDMFEKKRKQAFKNIKKLADSYEDIKESYKEYDQVNRFMAEYEVF